MSTIYTFHAECSTMDTLASGDELLVYDASTGRTVSCTPADIATYASGNLATIAVTGGGSFSGTSSVSYVIGSTLSSRVGFYGQTGTSAATTIAALTTTVTATGSCVGFATTASFSVVMEAINSVISALKAVGIVRT